MNSLSHHVQVKHDEKSVVQIWTSALSLQWATQYHDGTEDHRRTVPRNKHGN